MSDLSSSDVELTLDGQPVTLRCTLEAAVAINSHFQGFGNGHQGVLGIDIDAFAVIIRHGAGLDAKAARDLPRQIFATGVVNLIGPVAKYMTHLISGGREPKEGDAGEAQRGNPGAS